MDEFVFTIYMLSEGGKDYSLQRDVLEGMYLDALVLKVESPLEVDQGLKMFDT